MLFFVCCLGQASDLFNHKLVMICQQLVLFLPFGKRNFWKKIVCNWCFKRKEHLKNREEFNDVRLHAFPSLSLTGRPPLVKATA
jgi:hypothetical protein